MKTETLDKQKIKESKKRLKRQLKLLKYCNDNLIPFLKFKDCMISIDEDKLTDIQRSKLLKLLVNE
jgi:hypothetical protein